MTIRTIKEIHRMPPGAVSTNDLITGSILVMIFRHLRLRGAMEDYPLHVPLMSGTKMDSPLHQSTGSFLLVLSVMGAMRNFPMVPPDQSFMTEEDTRDPLIQILMTWTSPLPTKSVAQTHIDGHFFLSHPLRPILTMWDIPLR